MIGFRRALTTTLAIAAAAWPTGAYAVTDQDVPVAPKAAPQVAASPPQDLRSPDARAADRGPAVTAAESARVAPDASRPSVSDGFEWGDAGIGAAATLALVGVAGGTLLLVGRRRHRARTP